MRFQVEYGVFKQSDPEEFSPIKAANDDQLVQRMCAKATRTEAKRAHKTQIKSYGQTMRSEMVPRWQQLDQGST